MRANERAKVLLEKSGEWWLLRIPKELRSADISYDRDKEISVGQFVDNSELGYCLALTKLVFLEFHSEHFASETLRAIIRIPNGSPRSASVCFYQLDNSDDMVAYDDEDSIAKLGEGAVIVLDSDEDAWMDQLSEPNLLAETYFRWAAQQNGKDSWAAEELSSFAFEEPDSAWQAIQRLLTHATAKSHLRSIGKGPLHELLTYHEREFAPIVKDLAPRNGRLMYALRFVRVLPDELRTIVPNSGACSDADVDQLPEQPPQV